MAGDAYSLSPHSELFYERDTKELLLSEMRNISSLTQKITDLGRRQYWIVDDKGHTVHLGLMYLTHPFGGRLQGLHSNVQVIYDNWDLKRLEYFKSLWEEFKANYMPFQGIVTLTRDDINFGSLPADDSLDNPVPHHVAFQYIFTRSFFMDTQETERNFTMFKIYVSEIDSIISRIDTLIDFMSAEVLQHSNKGEPTQKAL